MVHALYGPVGQLSVVGEFCLGQGAGSCICDDELLEIL